MTGVVLWCRADKPPQKVIALLEEQPDLQLKNIQEFLQKEYDLKVTVSTISRQLSRANKARATRPGYKGKRPDLQPPGPQQAQPPPPAQLQDAYAAGAGTAPAQQPLPQPAQGQPADELQPQPAAPVQPTALPKLKCPYYACNPQRYASHPYCQSAWPAARDVKYVYSPLCCVLPTPQMRAREGPSR